MRRREERDTAGFVSRNFRWNFSALLVDTAAYAFGVGFIDAATVLPLLLEHLGASSTLIGFSQTVRVLGWTLPALFAAHYIQGKPKHLSFLLRGCVTARSGLLTLAPMLLLLATDRANYGVALAWFMIVYSIFWFVDGATVVSWFDIVAKVIPPRRRGAFFGAMQSLGGLVTVATAAVVAWVLASPNLPFPKNFALMSGLWAAGAVVSLVGVAVVREPAGERLAPDEKPGFLEYIGSAGPLLRQNVRLRRIIASRMLLEGGGLAISFYVLFSQQELKMAPVMVGVYMATKSIGRVVTGPLWGALSDKLSPMVGFRAAALTVAVIPGIAALAMAHSAWLLVVVYFLLGAIEDGFWACYSNAIFDSIGERERPLAMGLATVCQTPTALYGLIGGVLVQAIGFRPVFGIALCVTMLGFALAWRAGRAPRAQIAA